MIGALKMARHEVASAASGAPERRVRQDTERLRILIGIIEAGLDPVGLPIDDEVAIREVHAVLCEYVEAIDGPEIRSLHEVVEAALEQLDFDGKFRNAIDQATLSLEMSLKRLTRNPLLTS